MSKSKQPEKKREELTPLDLANKWHPEMVDSLPEGDHYGLRSVQEAVQATAKWSIAIIGSWMLAYLLFRLLNRLLMADVMSALRLLTAAMVLLLALAAGLVTLKGAHVIFTEWVRYQIQPFYINAATGQMTIGQRGWAALGMSDSSPDQADFQVEQITTPKQPFYVRWFFWHNQRVLLPKSDKRKEEYEIILPREAMVKFYAVQEKFQSQRTENLAVPMKSLIIQEKQAADLAVAVQLLSDLPQAVVDALANQLSFQLSVDDAEPTTVSSDDTAQLPVAEETGSRTQLS